MIKSSGQLIAEIESNIKRLKSKNFHHYYSPMTTSESSIMATVEIYFRDLGYETEFKKCHQCENKWDIIISW